MAEGADSVAAELIGRLERAWNEADGRAFGEPFAPDADFVERGTTLDQLQQRCAAPDARAALVGLGGVG